MDKKSDNKAHLSGEQLELEALKRENALLKDQLAKNKVASESLQTLQLAELIMENSSAVLFRRLADGDPKKRKMTYVSPNISRFGYKAEEFLSGTVMYRDLVYHEDSPRTLKEIEEFNSKGIENYRQQYRIVTREGEVRWVEDRTSMYDDTATGKRYYQGIVIDIHDKKLIEEQLGKSEEKHRRIIETAAEGFVLLDESFAIVDCNYAYEHLVCRSRDELMGTHPEEIVSVYLAYTKAQGQCDDIGCVQLEFECVLSRTDGKSIPVLIHASHIFSDSNSMLGIALFITDITSQKKALQLAAEVQKALFPAHSPEIAGLDIAGTSIPCDEVGGDYYDYITGIDGGNSVAVAVGDISGHGVDSALLMSSARGYLKVCSSQYDSPEQVVTSLNSHLVGDMSDSGHFMSLFYLTIDIEKKNLDWVRAGHDPALLFDPDTERFIELKGTGIALGVDPDFLYTVQTHGDLASGQIIMVMTDGIWEATNQLGEMYGKERLMDVIRRECRHSASLILQTVMQEHDSFTGEAVVHDDRTLILIKVV